MWNDIVISKVWTDLWCCVALDLVFLIQESRRVEIEDQPVLFADAGFRAIGLLLIIKETSGGVAHAGNLIGRGRGLPGFFCLSGQDALP